MGSLKWTSIALTLVFLALPLGAAGADYDLKLQSYYPAGMMDAEKQFAEKAQIHDAAQLWFIDTELGIKRRYECGIYAGRTKHISISLYQKTDTRRVIDRYDEQ